MTEANKRLMEVLQKHFNLPNLKEGKGQLEFDYKDEHILCGLNDERNNSYLIYDYKCWFWSKGDYDKTPNRIGRGLCMGLSFWEDDDFDSHIVEFFKMKVLNEDMTYVKQNFTENWKNIDKPVLEEQVGIKTCIESKSEEKKSDEPLTLFDFMED